MKFLLALTILLAPTYSFRFPLFGLPVNLLMVWVAFVFSVFILQLVVNHKTPGFVKSIKSLPGFFLLSLGLFFLSGLISLFWHGINDSKLGMFAVLFLQPISLFFIFRYEILNHPELKAYLLNTVYLLIGFMGIFAAIQYFTLIGLPSPYWGNSEEPKRALGFFGHPNFYSLFSAPLLAFLLPDLAKKISGQKWAAGKLQIGLWFFGLIGLLLSMSRSGWLGLTASAGVFLLLVANKTHLRIIFFISLSAITIALSVPALRWRIVLPFYGEKSSVSRLSLWQTGTKAIKESPFFGLGLGGFGTNWPRLNSDANLTEKHNFPHNIFLNFLTETGLLGFIAFSFISAHAFISGLKNKTNAYSLGISLFFAALLTQGQLDNPYFKNDLALIFWLILSFI